MYNNGGSMEETNGAADDKACLYLLKNSWFCCQQMKLVLVFFSPSVMLSPVNVARPYLNAGIVTALAKGCAIRVAHVLKLSSAGLLT